MIIGWHYLCIQYTTYIHGWFCLSKFSLLVILGQLLSVRSYTNSLNFKNKNKHKQEQCKLVHKRVNIPKKRDWLPRKENFHIVFYWVVKLMRAINRFIFFDNFLKHVFLHKESMVTYWFFNFWFFTKILSMVITFRFSREIFFFKNHTRILL